MIAPSFRRLPVIVAFCLATLATFTASNGHAAETHAASHPVPNTSWSVYLNANPTTINGSIPTRPPTILDTTLTASASSDVGPTIYYIQIWDLTAGVLLHQCATGTSCTASDGHPDATHAYVATIAQLSSTYPPPGLQAASYVNYVTWNTSGPLYFTVSLNVAQSTIPPYPFILTATASADVGPTPYYIEIFDVSTSGTGAFVGDCGSGTVCRFSYVAGFNDGFAAFISHLGYSLPPPGIVASSGSVG